MSRSARWALEDESRTLALGAGLAAAVGQGRGGYIELRGDLGAGKTCLCRGLLQALGHGGRVKSPTYTVMERYELQPPVLHMDLYRLADPMELEQLGLDEYPTDDHLWLVEWPQHGQGWLPSPDLTVELGYAGDARRAEVVAMTRLGQIWLTSLLKNFN